MKSRSASADVSRVRAFDGLRGVTILFVVVNHAGGMLWPRGPIDEIPLVRGLFSSGAVVVFFVVGGFIVTLNLLRDRERERFDPWRFYLRRLVRLGVQLVPLAVVVVLIHRFDDSDPYTSAETKSSLLAVLTHTFNYFARDNIFSARADLGHLWFLSVQQQVYLVLPLMVALLAARRRSFAALLASLAVAVVVWRYQVFEAEGWLNASMLTTTRSDGLFVGALLAVAMPWLIRFRSAAKALTWVGGASLLALIMLLGELPPFQFLHEWGIAFTAAAAVMVLAIYLTPTPSAVTRALSGPILSALGKASLAIFVWHMPVIHFVSRHGQDWSWLDRTLLATAVLAVTVTLAELLIERPTRRWLATSRVFRLTGKEEPAPAGRAAT